MYITEMDKVNFILEQARRSSMTLEDILQEYIRGWQSSRQLAQMIKGQQYYDNQTKILARKRLVIGDDGKLIEDDKLTNSKLNHAFVKKLVDQKTQYLFGLPPTIKCDNEAYKKHLDIYFNQAMFKKLKNICKEAVNKGIAWMQVYVDPNGDLKFKKIPSEQIIPIWIDDDHESLSAVIRLYDVEVYEGRNKKIVTKVEYWTTGGVTYYTVYNNKLILDVERESGAHFNIITAGEVQGMNFTRVPFIYFRYNEEENPLLQFIEALADDYDLHTSDDSNNILDSPNSTLILKGFDGENLGEFRRNLATYKVVKVNNNDLDKGDVVPLTVPINTADVKIHLEQLRKDLYETGRGVDTQITELGNASGVALKFIYADLDLDCNGIETEFQSSFQMMKFFIDAYLQVVDQVDFTNEKLEIILNRDILINETETISNCRNSAGLISDETIIANHPFVTDVDKELDRLKAQKEEDDQLQQALQTLNKGGGGSEQ